VFSLQPTPFDLHLHLLRIPIRVMPTFWLAAAILSWNPDRPDIMLLFAACMFGSIVFHELGHALTSEACGYPADIILYHFGGLAIFRPDSAFTPFKQLMVSLAGPIPQLCLGFAVLYGMEPLLAALGVDMRDYELLPVAWWFLVYINIGWALMNLLPVYPLDGGQSLKAILGAVGLRDAHRWTLQISVLTGALICAGMFAYDMRGTALLFLFLTIQNIQELQQRQW
jgi:Zn-dependent protease